jgi:glycosyltransferase involved in cell wall biosynthesis
LIEVPDYEGSAALWRNLPVPVTARLHGSVTYFAKELNNTSSRKVALLERQSLIRANAWCSCSTYALNRTEAYFNASKTASKVIYNFTDSPTAYPSLPRRSQAIIFAGSFVVKKGVVPLMHAWSIVASTNPRAELHIYGKDGRHESGASLQQHCLKLLNDAARRRTYLHGHVDSEVLRQAMNECRVAALPSYAEAFSLAPIEAMASGCSTIYTTRGSGHEVIDNGRDGILIDPDDYKALAESITELLANDELSAQLAVAGIEKVQRKFSSEAIVPINEAFYWDCIQNHRDR